jgi:hypothetical protein
VVVMATSPKPIARHANRSRKAGSKKAAVRPSADEERYLEIAMGLLDRMPDKEYQEAIGKIERLVKDSRASS